MEAVDPPNENAASRQARRELKKLIEECGALTNVLNDLYIHIDEWDANRIAPFYSVLKSRSDKISSMIAALELAQENKSSDKKKNT